MEVVFDETDKIGNKSLSRRIPFSKVFKFQSTAEVDGYGNRFLFAFEICGLAWTSVNRIKNVAK